MSIEVNSASSAMADKALLTSNLKASLPVSVTATNGASQPQEAHKVDHAELQKTLQEAVDRVNEQLRQNGRALNFSVDKASNRTVITVKNTESGEVIRQIPDETLLRVAHTLEELKGLLYNATI